MNLMQYRIIETPEFEKWISKNKDLIFQSALYMRLERIKSGHFGDHKQLSEHLFELRFFIGPGYRVYYALENDVILLLGSNKKQQNKAINAAKELFKQYNKE